MLGSVKYPENFILEMGGFEGYSEYFPFFGVETKKDNILIGQVIASKPVLKRSEKNVKRAATSGAEAIEGGYCTCPNGQSLPIGVKNCQDEEM